MILVHSILIPYLWICPLLFKVEAVRKLRSRSSHPYLIFKPKHTRSPTCITTSISRKILQCETSLTDLLELFANAE